MLVNFRQLGGIPTMDGRKIKNNMIYRSGEFSQVGEPELNYLKKLNIKRVFDYRGDNNFGKGYEFAPEVHSISASDHTSLVERFYDANKLTEDGSFQLMLDYYRLLPFNNPAYKNLVDSLRTEEGAFLQHCTAGKDRTGVGVVIVLWILGVSKEEIYKDYLKTEDHFHEIVNSDLSLLNSKYDWHDVSRLFKSRLANELRAKVEFLDAMYEEVIARYGTIEAYLFQEFGLTDEEIIEIRDKYLD